MSDFGLKFFDCLAKKFNWCPVSPTVEHSRKHGLFHSTLGLSSVGAASDVGATVADDSTGVGVGALGQSILLFSGISSRSLNSK